MREYVMFRAFWMGNVYIGWLLCRAGTKVERERERERKREREREIEIGSYDKKDNVKTIKEQIKYKS